MNASALLVVVTISVLTILSGCGKSKKQIEIDAANDRKRADVSLQMKLQELTAQQLKDPASAQFRNVRLNTARTAICGQVNAKNSFGGYVGFRDFSTSEKKVVTSPEGCGSTSVFSMPPETGTACLEYIKVTVADKACE